MHMACTKLIGKRNAASKNGNNGERQITPIGPQKDFQFLLGIGWDFPLRNPRKWCIRVW